MQISKIRKQLNEKLKQKSTPNEVWALEKLVRIKYDVRQGRTKLAAVQVGLVVDGLELELDHISSMLRKLQLACLRGDKQGSADISNIIISELRMMIKEKGER